MSFLFYMIEFEDEYASEVVVLMNENKIPEDGGDDVGKDVCKVGLKLTSGPEGTNGLERSCTFEGALRGILSVIFFMPAMSIRS